MNILTKESRFGLTNQEIAKCCPQVFQKDYSSSRTQKYNQFTTAEVIDSLRDEGYEVTSVLSQAKKNTQFSKHCVRLSHRNFLDTLKPNDERPEIVIVNSHDGSSSFRIMAGIFRLVCENGLIVADDKTADSRIIHRWDNEIESVKNLAIAVAKQAKESYELINQMKSQNLTESQQKAYAERAANIRLGYNKNAKIQHSENLLISRRHEDNLTPSIWNIYNVVQENCIKGGPIVGTRNLRELKNINQNIDVNRKLWSEAVSLIA